MTGRTLPGKQDSVLLMLISNVLHLLDNNKKSFANRWEKRGNTAQRFGV